MPITTTTIKTWVCPNCGYKQYHDPANQQEMSIYFSEPRYAGRPLMACPACYAGENPQRERGEFYLEEISGSDLSNLGQQTVASDDELEAREVEELNPDGTPVMEQVGERWELRVNQQTGEIYSEPVPIMQPKMRSLTQQELAELKLQRDLNLDALESVAVKELVEKT